MKKLPVTLSRTEFQRGLGFLCFQQLILPQLIGLLFLLLSVSPSLAQLNFIYFFINYIASILIFHKFLWAELEVAVEKPGKVFSSIAIGYLIYSALSTGMGYLVNFIDPEFLNLNDENIGAMGRENFALIAVGTVLFVPMAEELLFRGVLFNRIYEKRPIIACFTSVILFSMIHLIGFIGEYSPLHFLLAFLQYLPAGIALCFTYIQSGTIFAPILFHTLVNALAMYYEFTVR